MWELWIILFHFCYLIFSHLSNCFSSLDLKGNLLGILSILCIISTLKFGSITLIKNSATLLQDSLRSQLEELGIAQFRAVNIYH